MGLTIG